MLRLNRHYSLCALKGLIRVLPFCLDPSGSILERISEPLRSSQEPLSTIPSHGIVYDHVPPETLFVFHMHYAETHKHTQTPIINQLILTIKISEAQFT